MTPYLNQAHIEPIAADFGLSREELKTLLNDIRSQVVILDLLELAWKEEEPDVKLIYRNPPSEFVFIVSESRWDSLIEGAGANETEKGAAAKYNDRRARDLLASSYGGNQRDVREDEQLLVVGLSNIEVWREALDELHWWFGELAKIGLSPSEILDFWVTQEMSYSPDEWAEIRSVTAEAVRKNCRQARDKILTAKEEEDKEWLYI